MTEHEIVAFKVCAFGDGGHYYHEGFDRAVCCCGWRSAPSRDHKALVALFAIHAGPSPTEETGMSGFTSGYTPDLRRFAPDGMRRGPVREMTQHWRLCGV